MYKAWCCLEEESYCFSRSSVKVICRISRLHRTKNCRFWLEWFWCNCLGHVPLFWLKAPPIPPAEHDEWVASSSQLGSFFFILSCTATEGSRHFEELSLCQTTRCHMAFAPIKHPHPAAGNMLYAHSELAKALCCFWWTHGWKSSHS